MKEKERKLHLMMQLYTNLTQIMKPRTPELNEAIETLEKRLAAEIIEQTE